MGLLKAVHGAMRSVLDEQWREFFSCDAMGSEWLMIRAEKRIGKYSTNTRRDDNVLTNGSILSVADGQCVLVVKQGKVIDLCAEPGEHVFEDPEQGGVKGFFREVGKRVAFGGGDIQPTVYRVYYMNLLEITGIPFRSRGAVPMRVRDGSSGLDLDGSVFLSGRCSYRVSDPVKLYKTIIGNISGKFSRSQLNAHIQADLSHSLQPALGELAAAGLRPSELPGHVPELCEALRQQMEAGWCGAHGIELVSVALDGVRAGDTELLQSAQHAAILRDPGMAAATLTQAAAEALPAAAASGAGLRPMAVQTAPPPRREAVPRSRWTCSCGRSSDRRFCPDCGKPRPTAWICACGQENLGRFCRACGKPRPTAPESHIKF